MLRTKQPEELKLYEVGEVNTIATTLNEKHLDLKDDVAALEARVALIDSTGGSSDSLSGRIDAEEDRAKAEEAKKVDKASIEGDDDERWVTTSLEVDAPTASAVTISGKKSNVEEASEHEAFTLTIPSATATAAGLMSAADKVELTTATNGLAAEQIARINEDDKLLNKFDNYFTKDEIGEVGLLGSYVQKSTYTEFVSETNDKFSDTNEALADRYTEAEADAKFVDRTEFESEIDDRYTKSEVDTSIDELRDEVAATYDTIESVDEKLDEYIKDDDANSRFMTPQQVETALDPYALKTSLTNYYTIAQVKATINNSIYGQGAVIPTDPDNPGYGFIQNYLIKNHYNKVETNDEIVKNMWGYVRRNSFKKLYELADGSQVDDTEATKPVGTFKWIRNEDTVEVTPTSIQVTQLYTNPDLTYYLPGEPGYDPEHRDILKPGVVRAAKTVWTIAPATPKTDALPGTAGLLSAQDKADLDELKNQDLTNVVKIEYIKKSAADTRRVQTETIFNDYGANAAEVEKYQRINNPNQIQLTLYSSSVEADDSSRDVSQTVIIGEAIAPTPGLLGSGRAGIVTAVDKAVIDNAVEKRRVASRDASGAAIVETDANTDRKDIVTQVAVVEHDHLGLKVRVETNDVNADSGFHSKDYEIDEAVAETWTGDPELPGATQDDAGTAGLVSGETKYWLDKLIESYKHIGRDVLPQTNVNSEKKWLSLGIKSVTHNPDDLNNVYITENVVSLPNGTVQTNKLLIPIVSKENPTRPGLMTPADKEKLDQLDAGINAETSAAITASVFSVFGELQYEFNLDYIDQQNLTGPQDLFFTIKNGDGDILAGPVPVGRDALTDLFNGDATLAANLLSNQSFIDGLIPAIQDQIEANLLDAQNDFIAQLGASSEIVDALIGALGTQTPFITSLVNNSEFINALLTPAQGETIPALITALSSNQAFMNALAASPFITALAQNPDFIAALKNTDLLRELGSEAANGGPGSGGGNGLGTLPGELATNNTFADMLGSSTDLQKALVNDPEFINHLKNKINNGVDWT